LKGEEGFHQYFSQVYGDRWPKLFEALAGQGKLVRRVYSEEVPQDEPILSWDTRSMDQSVSQAFLYYDLDAASILPPLSLNPKSDSIVVDMCAAPGGKSLVLASILKGTGSLFLNDVSENRLHRLKAVVRDSLPEVWKTNIEFKKRNAELWGKLESETVDYILLDAPCSSERHHIHDNQLSKWSSKGSKGLQVRQYSLLCSAALALKPGGELVYSTCSINPLENEEVIKKHLKKKGTLEVVEMDLPIGEKLEVGSIALPDRDGWGPIYLCKLRKL
jgi:16S rRNA C967 or C1407 C5-methylase (RsmB/RsmF family)